MEKIASVAFFGGSSVFTSYLPHEQKHHVVFERQLRVMYPGQKLAVRNLADNGEFIARYFLRGTYERHREALDGLDVAIIRFGTNDQKRVGPSEYREQFLKFLDVLEEDFPGVAILLETGIYVDFPAHYIFDRNQVLQPYWEFARQLAAERKYPLIDYYARVRAESESGNWDVRVRKGLIPDASQDEGRENDPAWFTDIHPNPNGVRLAVDEELKVLGQVFPKQLPSGHLKRPREGRSGEYYEKLLSFAPDRLVVSPGSNPEKVLQ